MRIANDIYEDIQAMALKEDREISDFVRILLREALDARERRSKRKPNPTNGNAGKLR